MALYDLQYTGEKVLAWENYTSTRTPLSAGNLNKIQSTLADMDSESYNAINTLDQSKANKGVVDKTIKGVAFNGQTGVFTFTYVDNTIFTVNTNLERVIANFTFDSVNQRLVLIYDDGTTSYVDLSAFAAQYEFTDSATIEWTISGNTIVANIKNGSITGDHLETNYLSQAQAARDQALSYSSQSLTYSTSSKSYAVGNTNSRTGENTDNSKYYKDQAAVIYQNIQNIINGITPAFQIDFTTGHLSYNI